jgi:SNF2 family DNA or RNA helicase
VASLNPLRILHREDLPEVRKLRKYQQEAVDFLVDRKRAGNWLDMGLGKTPVSLIAMRRLTKGNVLVVCPKVAIGVWVAEIVKWLGESPLVYTGSVGRREQVWRAFRGSKKEKKRGRIIITNFAWLKEINGRLNKWNGFIIDEAHLLRNRKSQMFEDAQEVYSQYFFALTGSPIVNGPEDLWPLFNLIDPKKFRSYWRFINDYVQVFIDERGYRHLMGPKKSNIKEFRSLIKQYAIRLTKEDKRVQIELPDKTRQAIEVSLKPVQDKMYDQLCETLMAELNEEGTEHIVAPTKLARDVRLQQLLITPALLGGPNESAALEALEEKVKLEFDAKRPIIIFTPFVQAFPYIHEVLRKHCDLIVTVRGGRDIKKNDAAIAAFREHKGHKKAIIASILMATSWSAVEAKSAFFIGFDWRPSENFQAEDRIHRFGQHDNVMIYYIMNRNTIDEHKMARVSRKARWSNETIDPERLLRPRGMKKLRKKGVA